MYRNLIYKLYQFCLKRFEIIELTEHIQYIFNSVSIENKTKISTIDKSNSISIRT